MIYVCHILYVCLSVLVYLQYFCLFLSLFLFCLFCGEISVRNHAYNLSINSAEQTLSSGSGRDSPSYKQQFLMKI